jgi:hypothetical protein
LFGGNRLLADLAELLNGLGIEAQVLLAANQELGNVRAKVVDLRAPLQSC